MEKAILHNFVNLSTTICSRLQLNALTRCKGCLDRNEGKSELHILKFSLLFCYLDAFYSVKSITRFESLRKKYFLLPEVTTRFLMMYFSKTSETSVLMKHFSKTLKN